MGEFGDDYQYPKQANPSSKALLGGQNVGPDGADGDNAIFAVAFTNNILIPTDSDGSNPVYADAVTEFETWEGNVMLASKSALDGWTSALHSSSNVTITDAVDFEAIITAISADHGSFIMKFEKSGYNTLYCKVHVHKAKKGITGNTGDTGNDGGTGSQGNIGPTGNDGTGLVTVKKVIDVLAYTYFMSGASDSSGLLFASSVPHEMVLGDTVHHYAYTVHTEYNGDHKVTEIVSPTTYRVETLTYLGEDGGNGYSISDLRPATNDDPQDLEWKDMVPDGAALMELRLMMITEHAENELYAYLGYKKYPSTGWNFFLNGELYEEQGDQKAWPATVQPYIVQALLGIKTPSTSRANIHLRLTPYVGNNWSTHYTSVKFNLFAAYINHIPDTLGT